MVNRTLCAVGAGGLLLLCVGSPVESSPLAAPDGAVVVNKAAARQNFELSNAGTRLAESAGRITQVYGRAFSHGATAAQSAESFRLDHAEMFGTPAQEIVAVGPFADGHHVQPIMYDQATGTYKFTGFFYTQQRQGVPVFRSALRLLVRNEQGFPLVLAAADLRDLGALEVPANAAGPRQPVAVPAALQRAREVALVAGEPRVASTRVVIFAGVEDEVVEPRLADESIIEIGFDRWLFVTDAATGAILYEEQLIIFEDIIGTVGGMATEGIGTDNCEAESAVGMPHLEVAIPGSSVFTDANGDFVIPNGGVDEVTVFAALAGQWFDITDAAVFEEGLTVNVTPPGPANFLFNAANTSEFFRAEVNGYLHANVIRDFVLSFNPSYPFIANQQNFPVNVNRIDGVCPGNAWYNSGGGGSINFCRANGNAPNTAWSSVIYHEYGHHLVNVAGSGQGAYGEGMGDVMSVIILDSPLVGLGFFGNCNQPLRNAANNCDYDPANCSTCGSGIHICGTVLSGSVWETRNNLVVTEPADFQDIIAALAINAMLLHNGSSIDPSITIDYLTLDDDDANILNGTPHYDEINGGFTEHNMPAPIISLLAFDFPSGLPEMIAPGGGTTVPVIVSAVAATPAPGTGKLFLDSGAGFVEIPMTEITPNNYDAVFPAVECGIQASFYFSALTTDGDPFTSPTDAPLSSFSTISGTGSLITFADDFEGDLGWSVSTTALDGAWERAVPIPNSTCDRGNPGSDADGSGMCFVTDNSAANNCNSDVDDGFTILTSPVMDATDPGTFVTYWRWFDNTAGSNPNQDVFVVAMSSNGGTTWTNIETVGPATAESAGGWFQKSFRVADFVSSTNQFRIRFTAADTDPQSVVEAGVDGVELSVTQCDEQVLGDLDGDGLVGITDFLLLLGVWGPCPGPCPPACPGDLDSDCVVGITDFLLLLGNWSS